MHKFCGKSIQKISLYNYNSFYVEMGGKSGLSHEREEFFTSSRRSQRGHITQYFGSLYSYFYFISSTSDHQTFRSRRLGTPALDDKFKNLDTSCRFFFFLKANKIFPPSPRNPSVRSRGKTMLPKHRKNGRGRAG